MKKFLFILLIPICGEMSFEQTALSCNCPTGQNLAHQGAPNKIFYLSNGKSIGLCGDSEKVDQDTIYSEVILYHCGNGGFFRGWNGIKTCRIDQDNDTIVVRHIVSLPLG